MVQMNDAINALEYLISGDCTDSPLDYIDEIQFAIDELKRGQLEEEAPESTDDELEKAFDTLGGMMMRASNYDPDYIETDSDAIMLIEDGMAALKYKIELMNKCWNMLRASMRETALANEERYPDAAVLLRYYLCLMNVLKENYLSNL